jgi:selenide,water dikinase
VLGSLDLPRDSRVLVGFETWDDAGVFQLAPDLALVQTVDFFTPMVDDGYAFGAIAAANALSDVYAMGGEPLTALNILAFPSRTMPPAVLAAILQGGADKLREAGVALLGGHSVEDAVPKFGMAVTGRVHPRRILTNAGGRAGDRLILTRRLGTGIVATALKHGVWSADRAAPAVASMQQLNKAAGAVLIKRGAHACTDVTGFGLLGHLWELCRASGLGAELSASAVPMFDGVLELVEADEVPGGTERNLAHMQPHLAVAPGVTPAQQLVLADAQTSGGLLMAVAPDDGEGVHRALRAAGVEAWEIGRLVAGDRITLRE